MRPMPIRCADVSGISAAQSAPPSQYRSCDVVCFTRGPLRRAHGWHGFPGSSTSPLIIPEPIRWPGTRVPRLPCHRSLPLNRPSGGLSAIEHCLRRGSPTSIRLHSNRPLEDGSRSPARISCPLGRPARPKPPTARIAQPKAAAQDLTPSIPLRVLALMIQTGLLHWQPCGKSSSRPPLDISEDAGESLRPGIPPSHGKPRGSCIGLLRGPPVSPTGMSHLPSEGSAAMYGTSVHIGERLERAPPCALANPGELNPATGTPSVGASGKGKNMKESRDCRRSAAPGIVSSATRSVQGSSAQSMVAEHVCKERRNTDLRRAKGTARGKDRPTCHYVRAIVHLRACAHVVDRAGVSANA